MIRRRRWKYRAIIDELADDKLYTPSTIAAVAARVEPYRSLPPEELRAVQYRIRKAIALLARSYGFPPNGDGLVSIPGHQRSVGWFGRRWKAASREGAGQGSP